MFDTESILGPEPEFEVIHDREYRVRAYRMTPDRILLRGAICDQKPPGLYLHDDPRPLTVHHMIVNVEVAMPRLEIVAATVEYESYPSDGCPSISAAYGELVGLSIARGFTHRVRELFGGPRGCTHVTALLQAMAPVAVQCLWSMRAVDAREAGTGESILDPARDKDGMWRSAIGSCHIWDPDGAHVANLEAGVVEPMPVFMRQRLVELGRVDPTAG